MHEDDASLLALVHTHMLPVLSSCCLAGAKAGKSLLEKDEANIWHMAAAALPPLPATAVKLSDAEVDTLRQQVRQIVMFEAQGAQGADFDHVMLCYVLDMRSQTCILQVASSVQPASSQPLVHAPACPRARLTLKVRPLLSSH